MNAMDKHLLFDMSYALMRRFAFIEVGTPPEAVYEQLLGGPESLIRNLLPLRTLKDLGPAIYVDAAKYAHRRAQDGITDSRLVYEVFYAYFLPQFEGMDHRQGLRLQRLLSEHLDPAEQAESHRVISELLGEELLS
ncbi:unannotated protein [freshwater metagenome]